MRGVSKVLGSRQEFSLTGCDGNGLIRVRNAGHIENFRHEIQAMEGRSCTRLTDHEPVMLCWQEHSATLKQLGNVADASSGGIGVLVDHSMPIGTAVTISCPILVGLCCKVVWSSTFRETR